MDRLIDQNLINQCFNRNGTPKKFETPGCDLKGGIKALLRIKDQEQAINRFKWDGIPAEISSRELERMLYFKGNLILFKLKDTDKFYIMPYALNGTIDAYGRYNTVTPVPMSSGVEDKSPIAQLLSSKKFKVIYDEEQIDENEEMCVIIRDYTNQLSQTCVSRSITNESILDVMSDCVPFMRTNLLNSTGVKGIKVGNADDAASVKMANDGIKKAALNGETNVPIVGSIEFQELADKNVTKSEDFMSALQSLDNFRLSTYGLENGGVFQKKAHELQTEADMNKGPDSLIMQDGLENRQLACELANKIWGINMKVTENIVEEANEDVQYNDIRTDMDNE